MQKARDRYGYIDSIRGVAALSVVLNHVYEMIAHRQGALDVRLLSATLDWFSFGKFGVALFFIVSGFVVPFSLKGDRAPGLRRFALSRFFRLYPVYWLSIFAALALGAGVFGAPPTLRQVLVNLTMAQQFVGVANVIPVYWTLQIELVFYGLCALLFFQGRLSRPSSVFAAGCLSLGAALALAIVRYETQRKLPVAVPLALTLMLFGLLCRRGWLQGDVLAQRLAPILAGLYAALLPAVALLAYNRDFGFHEHWNVYVASYLAAIAAFALLTTVVRLEAPAFVWIGRISYSIYLFHPLVVVALRRPLEAMGLPLSLSFAVVVAVTLALCHGLYAFVEAPAVAWGRSLSERLESADFSAWRRALRTRAE